MSGNKKYFPNNWQNYKDAPDDMFLPHTFDEVMEWKLCNWELPSSVCCIIRSQNNKTGKVKEYIYQRHKDAQKKVYELLHTPDIEILVCDHDSIHQLITEGIDE
jgi:hypothetical protein